MSEVQQIDLSTEDDQNIILNRLDDRDIGLHIIDGEGNDMWVRVRGEVLHTWLGRMIGREA